MWWDMFYPSTKDRARPLEQREQTNANACLSLDLMKSGKKFESWKNKVPCSKEQSFSLLFKKCFQLLKNSFSLDWPIRTIMVKLFHFIKAFLNSPSSRYDWIVKMSCAILICHSFQLIYRQCFTKPLLKGNRWARKYDLETSLSCNALIHHLISRFRA